MFRNILDTIFGWFGYQISSIKSKNSVCVECVHCIIDGDNYYICYKNGKSVKNHVTGKHIATNLKRCSRKNRHGNCEEYEPDGQKFIYNEESRINRERLQCFLDRTIKKETREEHE